MAVQQVQNLPAQFVQDLGQDLAMYNELKRGFNHLFLQPLYDEGQSTEWNGMNFHGTFEMVRSNPEWRLSLQTHKWMGVE